LRIDKCVAENAFVHLAFKVPLIGLLHNDYVNLLIYLRSFERAIIIIITFSLTAMAIIIISIARIANRETFRPVSVQFGSVSVLARRCEWILAAAA